MCGLTYAEFTFDPNTFSGVVNKINTMMRLSSRRGADSRGVVVKINSRAFSFKEYDEHTDKIFKFLSKILKSKANTGDRVKVLAHFRMKTNGDKNFENTQPLVSEKVCFAHNGIVVNDKFKLDSLDQKNISDSVFLYEKLLDGGGSGFHISFEKVCKELNGANNVICMHAISYSTYFFTTHGSLYFVEDEDAFFVSSEAQFVRKASGLNPSQFSKNKLFLLKNGTVEVVVDLNNVQKNFQPSVMSLVSEKKIKKFSEIFSPTEHIFDEVSRCKECLLPDTVPFICLNKEGICRYCAGTSHQDWEPKYSELDLSNYLQSKKRILFPFSGGRDSSFGLYKLRKMYKGEIIAYTYDWGMVTDLARRNISSVCGNLGVEHVLVNPPIETKLRNVRLNVEAWLNKPSLATVPLFMAGDKQYFYYMNKIAHETNAELSILSSNPFERTDFKSGFCGIDAFRPDADNFYSLSKFDKIKMLYVYGKEFLKNPKYINLSMADTIGAFLSYYSIPHTYISLYDYVPWREDNVDATLRNNLTWEFGSDTRSSWRIGDGTAAFYNYIYLIMAGFTENDALRSNQIRAGHITREKGLSLLRDDNKIRYESIYWYLDRIGLDPFSSILKLQKNIGHGA